MTSRTVRAVGVGLLILAVSMDWSWRHRPPSPGPAPAPSPGPTPEPEPTPAPSPDGGRGYVIHPPTCHVVEVRRDPAAGRDDPRAPIRQEADAVRWLAAVNAERRHAGYRDRSGHRAASPPLRHNPALQRAAEWKVLELARTGTMSHQDTGVWTRLDPIPPVPGYRGEPYERTPDQRAWAFGFPGQASEGIGMGDDPACLAVDRGFPGQYDIFGHRLCNHHEDGMDPGWTEFGFAARDGWSCALYGRLDRYQSTPAEERELHQADTFYGSEAAAGREPPPPLP